MRPEQSYACTCIPPGSPSEALAGSAVVFMGEVVSVREYEGGRNALRPDTVEFDVKTVWKGPDDRRRSLKTNGDSASCGFPFVEGNTYIVYSRFRSKVSLCSRTRRVSEADYDLAVLGKGRGLDPVAITPAAEGSESQTGGGCGVSPHATDLSVMGLVVGVALLGLRRQRSGGR